MIIEAEGRENLLIRLALMTVLEAEVNIGRYYQIPPLMIVLDIDFFKQVNDKFGYKANDQILHNILILITETLRSSKLVARWSCDKLIFKAGLALFRGMGIERNKVCK
ncbi:MAG: diguanylate cyclase (GGDEF)-like protein [Oleispira sp.]